MHHYFPALFFCWLSLAEGIAHRQYLRRSLEARGIGQGWPLQASACPSTSTACGDGSCCPTGLFCVSATNNAASTCCASSSDCRDFVESNPTCADPAWSLWAGPQGNSFCCQDSQVGFNNYGNTEYAAGHCGSSVPADSTPAVIISKGAGAASAKSTASTLGRVSTRATNKPVFFHYMVGTITDAHCERDILDALALGVDAFALNINTVSQSWATNTVSSLFKWANTHGFKLFFSFDMTGFSSPSDFTDFLLSYVTNGAYYTFNGKPFVSTFNGGASTYGESSVNDAWQTLLIDVMSKAGHPIYFVPAFQDTSASSTYFSTYPSLDGAMNWNSWPWASNGKVVVPTTDDETYLAAARSAGKTFMMGLSPLQFKHTGTSDNWYRRGEANLEYRFGQILNLQPDFIEIQTWNDAGESHYMGNSWSEPISGTAITAYTNGYDHTGYWQVLPSFIKAWKGGKTTTSTMYPTNGASAQGVFWHHTMLVNADCSSDSYGKPSGYDTAEDKVTGIVLVASGYATLQVVVKSGSSTLGTQTLKAGYNSFSFSGLTTGSVIVEVSDTITGAKVITGTGPISVSKSASLCNYNFQVVGLK